MIKATALTERSWLLSRRVGKLGLLRKIEDGYAIMGGPFPGKYVDIEKLESQFNEKIKFVAAKKVREEKEETFIEGYPVKHETTFLLESDQNLHTYVKKEGSSDIFVAGYFCIQFKGKWQSSFCPRAKTLGEHPWKGPFKDKLTMDHTIRVENK